MELPALKPSGREREFSKYSPELREEVVYAFVFDGLGYRELDDVVLGLDRNKSLGYQSMGIIHYLGLNSFKGIFANSTIEYVLRNFPEKEEYQFLYEILDRCRIRRLSDPNFHSYRTGNL